MSWREKDLMNLRKDFIKTVINGDVSFQEACRRFNISTKTGYKWWNRYNQQGADGLKNQSRCPHISPNKTSEHFEELIIHTRDKHKAWGARKIRAYLINNRFENVPAESTINKVLRKNGLIDETKKKNVHLCRFEHDAPNILYQMDFKGHFKYRDGRCHPLTMMDDHSRYGIILKACANEQSQTVKEALIETFRRSGMPVRINIDNGSPWGASYNDARYTVFSLWLLDLGINVSFSRPHNPQTNGKIERFHRTLNEEVIKGQNFLTLCEIQQSFDKWLLEYNYDRPHEAIGNVAPASRYKISHIDYPEVISDYEYSGDYQTRVTDQRGRISVENRMIFVGTPFAKKKLGIRMSLLTGELLIYYRHKKLGSLDMSQVEKGTMVNLYSGRVLVT